MKPLGILGGTFDPIHFGHLRPAQEVRQALGLAEIRLLPAANPSHRQPPVATAKQRLRMVELAAASVSGFTVDDREFRRAGWSYTVPTLESLRQEFGARPLCLLLGMDAFEGLATWHQWQRLPELAHLVVMTRPGWIVPARDALPAWVRDRIEREPERLAQVGAGKIYFQTVTPQDISASRIREAIGRGEPVEESLPPAVLEYIRSHHIYIHRGS
ncbi:MAG: nicotinate-nucleotide adenylyltransferase [Sulfuricaulis sp.]